MDGKRHALIRTLAAAVGARLAAAGQTVTVAESCTGGLLAAALTDVPGSSAWFGYGFVTYAPEAKHRLLGVAWERLDGNTIVSEATALSMARGALAVSGADIAIGVTGIAGPTGGTPECPVGTVAIGWAADGWEHAATHRFTGDRSAVRAQAVVAALDGLQGRLGPAFPG
ncbi:CinA family protein [Acidiferrobacter thiooxydans]|jgi:nicotinamide-nucleotide amidase|uniref:CinA family protein n=1 Tax=Acidiferrobacter thiooxydans TaxID=163359 RepID=A0A1C2G1N9_9GAMM|nr:CinA family protein [Acidiferrobacter thiooxydans]MDA8191078.1 CinA family protein [Gammaproteobacteria bacterium]RCN59054.1 CinA family protein [Acidiferrobacter thiooxydans]UEO00804.1 CinA family protein [Acidiferrobacter thiooxydans]